MHLQCADILKITILICYLEIFQVELNASGCALMSNSIVRSVLCGCRCLDILVLDHCQRVTDAAFNPHESPFEAFAAAGQLKTLSLRVCSDSLFCCVVCL